MAKGSVKRKLQLVETSSNEEIEFVPLKKMFTSPKKHEITQKKPTGDQDKRPNAKKLWLVFLEDQAYLWANMATINPNRPHLYLQGWGQKLWSPTLLAQDWSQWQRKKEYVHLANKSLSLCGSNRNQFGRSTSWWTCAEAVEKFW